MRRKKLHKNSSRDRLGERKNTTRKIRVYKNSNLSKSAIRRRKKHIEKLKRKYRRRRICLLIIITGYRANKQGKKLVMNLGF
ncbi:MAG: hypothetical protein Q4B52_02470, partial [Tissierellia bacterium]|nr:hypothetical protein [Tissierellia bacterium]